MLPKRLHAYTYGMTSIYLFIPAFSRSHYIVMTHRMVLNNKLWDCLHVISHNDRVLLLVNDLWSCSAHTWRNTHSPFTVPREIIFSARSPCPWPSDIDCILSLYPISLAKRWNASKGSDSELRINISGMRLDVSWYLKPEVTLCINIDSSKQKQLPSNKGVDHWTLLYTKVLLSSSFCRCNWTREQITALFSLSCISF